MKYCPPPLTWLIPIDRQSGTLLETLQSIHDDVQELQGISMTILVVQDKCKIENDFIMACNEISAVRFVMNQFEKGISGSLNTGLKLIETGFVARIDMGDKVISGRTKSQYDALIQNTKIDLVYSDMMIREDKQVKQLVASSYLKNSREITPFDRIPHPTWMFRVEKINSNYQTDAMRCEDFVFLLENELNIVRVPETHVEYDTSNKLNFLIEFRSLFYKLRYYYIHSNSVLKIPIIFAYAFVRSLRLILTKDKVFVKKNI